MTVKLGLYNFPSVVELVTKPADFVPDLYLPEVVLTNHVPDPAVDQSVNPFSKPGFCAVKFEVKIIDAAMSNKENTFINTFLKL